MVWVVDLWVDWDWLSWCVVGEGVGVVGGCCGGVCCFCLG